MIRRSTGTRLAEAADKVSALANPLTRVRHVTAFPTLWRQAMTMGDKRTGVRVGPLSVDVRAPAAAVYTTLASVASQAAVDPPADDGSSIPGRDSAAPDETVRTFSTPVTLPFGLRFTARTREAVRSLPPDTLEFRHLSGPVRGLEPGLPPSLGTAAQARPSSPSGPGDRTSRTLTPSRTLGSRGGEAGVTVQRRIESPRGRVVASRRSVAPGDPLPERPAATSRARRRQPRRLVSQVSHHDCLGSESALSRHIMASER